MLRKWQWTLGRLKVWNCSLTATRRFNFRTLKRHQELLKFGAESYQQDVDDVAASLFIDKLVSVIKNHHIVIMRRSVPAGKVRVGP